MLRLTSRQKSFEQHINDCSSMIYVLESTFSHCGVLLVCKVGSSQSFRLVSVSRPKSGLRPRSQFI
jgi:hypothetical protein